MPASNRSMLINCLSAIAVLLSAANAVAQATLTPGTYMLEGGSYTIDLEMDGDQLLVREPNKNTHYSRQPDGSFHGYNPNTDTTYGIRVLDGQSIEAFKPGVAGNIPSRLVLIASAIAAEPEISSEESDRWADIADNYFERSQSDPANVQSWTACAAVAIQRSIDTEANADMYAEQMAAMLKQLYATASPCPEVIAF